MNNRQVNNSNVIQIPILGAHEKLLYVICQIYWYKTAEQLV